MDSLLIMRGHTFLGHTTRDKDGNVIEKSTAHFEADVDGPTIAVVPYNSDKDEPAGEVDIFSVADSFRLSKHVFQKLGINIHALSILEGAIIAAISNDPNVLCEECPSLRCDECPVKRIKDTDELLKELDI